MALLTSVLVKLPLVSQPPFLFSNVSKENTYEGKRVSMSFLKYNEHARDSELYVRTQQEYKMI